MTPFHSYVDHLVAAIRDAGRIDDMLPVYFHDLPAWNADRSALDQMTDPFRPDLDPVLPLVPPMRDGRVYSDDGLTVPRSLAGTLAHLTAGTSVLIVSDAGAARRKFDIVRLLDTVALLKAVMASGAAVTWLNPVPPERWRGARPARSPGTYRCSLSPGRAFTRPLTCCAGAPGRWSIRCERPEAHVRDPAHRYPRGDLRRGTYGSPTTPQCLWSSTPLC